MKTIESRHIDKVSWPEGVWQGEYDNKQWRDETTGLPCLVVRVDHTGHLCGYVGVSKGHPLYEVYDNNFPRDVDIDVHGGVTFTGKCSADEHGICHKVEPGEDDDVWWIGFDHSHCGDLYPTSRERPSSLGESYKTTGYVEAQCRNLATQLAAMTSNH